MNKDDRSKYAPELGKIIEDQQESSVRTHALDVLFLFARR
jgi:hypothetical protein